MGRVQCSACDAENREGRRFCAQCGATLSAPCSSCGFANEPDERFCGGCGTALAGAAPAAPPPPGPEAERRQVAILFADLSRFTELSRACPPEAMHRIMNRFFETVDGVIEAYGGTVDKHIGDAVMAVFGAPVAHTNDHERAVRAALDIHAAMPELGLEAGETLEVHIGVASGQVMASGVGSESHSEYTVMGDSVNLASRLVDMAAAGETYISDAVHRAVPDLVKVDAMGDVTIKGLGRPVTVWRLRGLDTAPDRSMRPLVGRKAQLRQFHGVLDAFRETGVGQIVFVRGEAGIGKSRLVEEFAVMAERAGFANHTGLVLDFGVGKGQEAIEGIVRGLLGIPPGSEISARRQAAAHALDEELYDRDQIVFVFDLLDLPQDADLQALYHAMDNEARTSGKQACVATLLRRLGGRQPVMVTVEDVHSADAQTLAHLAAIAATAAECPVLLVMTSRTEGDPIDQAWRYAAAPASLMTIDLVPLSGEESRALASEYMDASNRFAADCVKRAEGNPLFLEQLLRSALASEEEEVPGSVQSIVLARVDRLSAADKQALQAAAVLGQRFSLEVLRHLNGVPDYLCDGLVAQNLVRPGGGDFLFAHAMIWESVYSSLLGERRQELHRRAADWFAVRDMALRAEHLDRAGDPAAAGAYIEAARTQAGLLRTERALELVEKGLAATEEAGDRYALFSLEGECLLEAGRPADSVAAHRRAFEVARDDVERCRAWIGLAAGMRVTDEYDEAFRSLDLAQDVANARGLQRELSRIHYYRGSLYFPLGDIDGCLAEHERALDYAVKGASPEQEALALSGLGDAYYSRGRMITALDYFRRCIELSRVHGFGRIEIANQYMIAWNRMYLNEIDGALEDALAAIEAARRARQSRAEMVAQLAAARVQVERADMEAAEAHVARGLELADSLGANRFRPFLTIFLGRVRMAQEKEPGETVRLLKEAFEVSRHTGIGFLGPWVLSTLALASPDAEAAREALAEGERILAEGCVGHNYFGFYRDAIEVSARAGAWDEVERHAQALEAYMSAEPLPWCEFYIARGRALAAAGNEPSGAALAELGRLRTEAKAKGLLVALPALEQA